MRPKKVSNDNKTYTCKWCGKGGFGRYQIPQHVKNCEKRPEAVGKTEPGKRPYKPRRKKVQPSSNGVLKYCPHCGSNLVVIAAALAAAKEVSHA